ncbi:hypothetical protein FJY63_05635 [Candidatus Sumerlaeota bacterium]|nr:hypothetical protein [Candidatus Sumerlaeota bacterium]
MILTNRPFDFYNALTPIVSNSAPPEPLSPTEQLAFLLVLEPAGRKSIFLHAAETPGNKLLALWQEPQDEGCVQSTAACLTASSAQFDVLLGVIADRPTVKILNCQVYDGAIVPR